MEIIGKPLRWQLIPVRLNLETFEALKRIAPDGDVKRLIQETITKTTRTQKHKNRIRKNKIRTLVLRMILGEIIGKT